MEAITYGVFAWQVVTAELVDIPYDNGEYFVKYKRVHFIFNATFCDCRSGEMIIMTTRSEVDDDEISPGYWIPSTFVSGFMVLYCLVHAIVYIEGAWQSCHEYRIELIKHMSAHGNLVQAVQVQWFISIK